MRIVAVVGRKNSGKTTLVVALAREFTRRGKRVMTIKRSSHPTAADTPGTDSWRQFHEGGAERTLLASPDQRIVFERSPDDTDPEALARRYFTGADLVLVEGFKRAPLPRIEVHRSALELPPLYDPTAANAHHWLAIVTDDPALTAGCHVLRVTDTMWFPLLTTLAWDHAKPLS